jgi:hypothetical protein
VWMSWLPDEPAVSWSASKTSSGPSESFDISAVNQRVAEYGWYDRSIRWGS